MNCAWDAYLNLLSPWICSYVDKHGKGQLEELRLRIGLPPELILKSCSLFMDRPVSKEDLTYTINAASRYSPWSAATSAYGYITAPGGHRIGMCGEANMRDGAITGIVHPYYLCLRVARDYIGIAKELVNLNGSLLIIGLPGSGKTTLLRDLIRQISFGKCRSISVVDERGELFPFTKEGSCFETGPRTDVLTGCSKSIGIEMVLRTMSPSIIALDEITAQRDCEALIYAGWCGVKLLATAHAGSKSDLLRRPVYKPLLEKAIFDYLVVLNPDKTWTYERMKNAY